MSGRAARAREVELSPEVPDEPDANRRPPPPPPAAAFTLTEIMIALALTALLLVGISKIFAITSTTISSGQALAKAMRQQKAIQTSLSADFLGIGDIGTPQAQSGMLPLVNTLDADYASPYFMICNYRVAAYRNQSDMASDTVQPADPGTGMNITKFRQRSLDIRGVDLNKDGDESDVGEVIPLYNYGDRNFRTDMLGFFTRGSFHSDTSANTSTDPARSNAAYVWYGHLRTFNSTGSQLDITNGYGCPGAWLTPNSTTGTTPGELQNLNNRFADQFILGRVQGLLIDPIVPDASIPTGTTNNSQNDNTVSMLAAFKGRDPTQPLTFIARTWANPTYIQQGSTPAARPSMSPLSMLSNVYKYSNGQNRLVKSDDRLSGTTPAPNASAVDIGAPNARTDVIGVSVRDFRKRARFAEAYDASTALASTAQSYWWEDLPVSWTNRYYVNPFVRASQFVDPTDVDASRAINPKSLAQRSQILAQGASQFIVEYAGDFVGQNPDGSLLAGTYSDGTLRATTPDGVLDFVVVGAGANAIRQTRWYGMPRDVDGDGTIPGIGNNANLNSPDVIPLSDFANTRRTLVSSYKKIVTRATGDTDESYALKLSPSTAFSFEHRLPMPAAADYSTVTIEPVSTIFNSTGDAGDPTGTSYQCVWGPSEFERTYSRTVGGNTVILRMIPQLIRILVDIRDPNGSLKEAVTQEYAFPIRGSGAIGQTQP